MSQQRESHLDAESLVNVVLSEGRARMSIRRDFAEEIARNAVAKPASRGKSRAGLPAVVIVVASVLTASTAIAGIAHFVRQGQQRSGAPFVTPCVECEPQTHINPSQDSRPNLVLGAPSREMSASTPLQNAPSYPPMLQPPFRTLTQEMRIVSSDSLPQTQLSSARYLLAAPDGFIFVVDQGSPIGIVRLYDASGKYVRSFGRLGEGPGEFSSAGIFGAAGDSVLLYDFPRGNIHVYRRNGSFVRTHNLAGVFRGDRQLRGFLSGGRVLVEISHITWGRGKDSTAFRITDSTTREIARIAVQNDAPAGPRVWNGQPGPIVFNSDQPFLPRVQIAQNPLGNRALAALPSGIWGGKPGQVKLVLMNKDGIQSERILDVGARRMTTAIRDAWIKASLDPRGKQMTASRVTRAAAEAQLRDQTVMPQHLPEINNTRGKNVLLGSDGTIWLRPFDLDDWVVISPAGTVVARVRVPAGLTVHQVSMDRMWGVLPDTDGVPTIIRYRLSSG